MKTEDELCDRYQKRFAAIASLDGRYYQNPCPSLAERREYATRQSQLEELRTRLYADLAALRACREFRSCRSVMRQSRFRSR